MGCRMSETEQEDTVAFLESGQAFAAETDEVERIDTHAARIFLAGDEAIKLKRAVTFPFLDFASLAARKDACEKELHLNRRTAPALYRDVVPVTRDPDGRLALDGAGEAIDWVVRMHRFGQDGLLDRVAARGDLDGPLLRALADHIALFHRSAEPRPDHGGPEVMAAIARDNLELLRTHAGEHVGAARLDRLGELWQSAIATHAVSLEKRRGAGKVRHCHGDLHLRNICLLDGKPTLFDCIEFNESFACIDVLYDLAFLLMDLQHRDAKAGANLVMNRYLARAQDYEGIALLPLFQSIRAGVRAMVSAMEAAEADAEQAKSLIEELERYVDFAIDVLMPRPLVAIAIGGLSGSGKTVLAEGLAPDIGAPPGAVVLRSDVIRKTMAGQDPETPLSAQQYQFQQNQRVYARMGSFAGKVLEEGQPVVMDAVFARPEERAMAARIADNARCPFYGLWLEAPVAILKSRLGARTGDASDADESVLETQTTYKIGALDWTVIDAAGDVDRTLAKARAALPAMQASQSEKVDDER